MGSAKALYGSVFSSAHPHLRFDIISLFAQSPMSWICWRSLSTGRNFDESLQRGKFSLLCCLGLHLHYTTPFFLGPPPLHAMVPICCPAGLL